MQSTDKLLSIIHLKKYFPVKGKSIFRSGMRYVRANEDISFDIYRGETLGLVGESGCGKSTLGRTILQLYDPSAGAVMYYGTTRAEVDPAYVRYTLKNAASLIASYQKQQQRVQAWERACESHGDKATFEELQNCTLARARLATQKKRLGALLGGFMTLSDPEEGAALLLERHMCQVKLQQLAKEQKGLSEASARSLARREWCLEQYCKTQQRLQEAEDRLEQLRAAHGQDTLFEEYEQYLDDGIDLSQLKYPEMRRLRKHLQIIFQDPYSSLNPRMTVGQIIEEGLVTHGMFRRGSARLREAVLAIMQDCGLQEHMIHRYPHQFSGGQRQRISIARALAVEPAFVVCDECVSALDVSIQSQIINLLQRLKHERNLTYLFISHDLSVVRYLADRIGVMYLGDMVEFGGVEEVFGNPRHPYTVALLSSVPTTDAAPAKKKRIILSGSIPSPIHPPTGCKFHTRCYMAQPCCRRVPPPLVEVSPGHFAACHFADREKQVASSLDGK